VSTLDRRTLFRAAGALGLAAGLSACGGGSDTAAQAPAEAAARSVAHKYGSTEISGAPQRVVTVGLTEQDYVLALGLTPVGVREWFGGYPGALWPWAAEASDGTVPEVLPVLELNFEQIAALTPDLILGINSALTQEEYDTLSAIAPTVAQPAEFADYGAPWQTITTCTGIALGVPEQAAALVTEIEGQFADVRDANPQFAGRTGLLAALLEDGTYYIYAEGPAPRFLVDLGFSLPEPAAALFTGESRPPVLLSPEQLGVIDADVVLLGVYGDTAAAGQADDPVYQALPAVAAGRVVSMPELSDANGAITFGSPLSLPDALEILPPLIAAAVDGDPATAVPAVA
jgi:iron complex transport system substrate-binding protein